MQSFSLTVCRFVMAAWVGGAVLFVVTSVAEQRGPDFDNVIRDQLAVMRFPFYYGFGFVLIGVGLVTGLVACGHAAVGRKSCATLVICTILALIIMVVDYVWIYRPLVQLITPAGTVRTSDFVTYHSASKYINMVQLTLCLIAAIAVCLPGRVTKAAAD